MTKGSEPEEYDALIVGVGASGSVFCKELAKAGLEVLALDAGPYLKSIGPTGRLLTPNPNFRDSNDEVKYSLRRALMWNEPETWRSMANEDAVLTTPGLRHRCVGGPLVYAGQALRFHESDFREKSESGAPKGTGVEDWPISYADLEPYYEKAEFELGVSGKKGADPFEAPRKNEFPFPPLEEDYNSALFSETCERLGYHPAPTPLAILPRDHNGRGACNYCGNCQPYPCYVNAKASPLITIIPQAEKTGLCHIRPFCYVTEVVVNRDGDAKGVKYLDKGGRRREARGKIVILCNLGAYVARLLLLSKSQIYPKGIGNNYDQVGKYIMGFGVCDVFGSFDHQLIHSERTGPLSIEHICDFDEDRPKNLHGQDFIRGGCIHPGSAPLQGPISSVLAMNPSDVPSWGEKYVDFVRKYFSKYTRLFAVCASMPCESNFVDLDPNVTDSYGLPALRTTFTRHKNDDAMGAFIIEKSKEIVKEAGASKTWVPYVQPQFDRKAQSGGLRMGKDPELSVVDPFCQVHGIYNLFTGGNGAFVTHSSHSPALTIMALAYRTADHIISRWNKGDFI